MKTIKIFSAFMLLFSVSTFAQKITTADLQVTGLTCSMCSNATQKSLETLSFINNIEPDLNKNVFVLTFKTNEQINLDQINQKVEDAGFSVGGLTADFDFDQVQIDENGQALVNGIAYRFLNAKSKILNGTVKATVIGKEFLSSSNFKKQAATIKSEAFNTGSAVINGKKTRVYYLRIS